MRLIESSSGAARLAEARAYVERAAGDAEILIVAASRGAADDFVRAIAVSRGATFGLHRFSLTQLAARLAAPALAAAGRAPVTSLGAQAVAARAAFEAQQAGALTYFAPVVATPGFPRALARTLEELALATVRDEIAEGPARNADRDIFRGPPEVGDVGELVKRFDAELRAAAAADRASLFDAAAAALARPGAPFAGCPLVLLDVPAHSAAEGAFVAALAARATDGIATIAAGDGRTIRAMSRLGSVHVVEGEAGDPLDRLRRQLFAPATSGSGPGAAVELFSAPGEGREAVEIARRVLREARGGVPFDEMAIAVRAPHVYAGLLEHALGRAGVPAYFDRGTRRPHPAGRAFLALLACALEGFSARRFAEYLSLAQVPDEPSGPADAAMPASADDVFGIVGERSEAAAAAEAGDEVEQDEPDGADASPEEPRARAWRSPWRWERALVESRVVAGADRWRRRLAGLVAECRLQRSTLERSEPDSPRIDQLDRRIADLEQLSRFAVPIIEEMAAWPGEATWGGWLDRFERLAPRVLKRPERVLRVLADLRPMGDVGPVSLDQAAAVLRERLATIEAEPPARRFGRVLVTTPSRLRGRAFRVVFVPALAERVFPQKLREDPLLLDEARAPLVSAGVALITAEDRAEQEKLELRLAIGAATERLYVSFPTLEIGQARPRVPSLYALEVWRALTGEVPSADELQQAAARSTGATLAWPAPASSADAIDALEHDLALLAQLDGEPDERARGRAQYILRLSPPLQRSVRERYMRARRAWSAWDGIVKETPRIAPALARARLTARPYSLSALQKYAVCPYQFLLSAVFRLRPADDIGPLQRLDPLTRGSLFHEMQTEFYRRMKAAGDLPVAAATRDRALQVIDACVLAVASKSREDLAPAIDRVWDAEIGAIRRDLRLWVDRLAHEDREWLPLWFEWSFGLPLAGRDPASRADEVLVDGRFPLRGSIDLVEERAGGALRVTDHKTGRFRGKDRMVINGGEVLQPVLYGLALEAATSRPVDEGRLYYATTDGGYRDARIPLTPAARRAGLEALEIIDRAVERGVLVPAPVERPGAPFGSTCAWCDFRPVCGSGAARRAARKTGDLLADLAALRNKP